MLFIVKKHGKKPNEMDKETAKRNVVNLYCGILCSHYIEQIVSTHLYWVRKALFSSVYVHADMGVIMTLL